MNMHACKAVCVCSPCSHYSALKHICIKIFRIFSYLLLSCHLILWQPELSAMLDALEQSACNPEVASDLAKSLLRILQLSAEKTIASFKSLDAAARVLKVTCVQVQESKRLGNIGRTVEGNTTEAAPSYTHQRSLQEIAQGWVKCMETSMELFMEFFSATDDARSLVLHSSTCIDCLFDLFWEEDLRNNVLKYILELLKVYLSLFLSFFLFFFS